MIVIVDTREQAPFDFTRFPDVVVERGTIPPRRLGNWIPKHEGRHSKAPTDGADCERFEYVTH